MSSPATPTSGWREPMVWLVVSGPVAVILASIVTVTLCIRHPDPPLQLRATSAQAADEVPALTARNHAATGTAEVKR